MSFGLKLSSLSDKQRKFIAKNYTIKGRSDQYNPRPPSYQCFIVNKEEDIVLLPLGVWKEYLDEHPNDYEYPKMNDNVKFTKSLLTIETDPSKRGRDQNVIVDLALKRLYDFGTVFLSLFTGYGKTLTSIYLSIVLGLKTLVLCHLNVVKGQWPEEYALFTSNTIKVQYLKGKNIEMDESADVYIVGIKKASKMDADFFESIGTVIVDESHLATITDFTKTLFKFQPRYLIGLSATYDRKDGLEKLLYPYFGQPDEFIVRKETKPFTVYKYQTEFVPEIEYILVKNKSVVCWNTIIRSIEENPKRWELIGNIAIKHPEHKILILCGRNVGANGVFEYLLDKNESVELLIGNTKVWNKKARITVAGIKKAGVGMNDPNLTMCIIASDMTDVRQCEGRIRTVNSVVYHIVDNYKTFEAHYRKCEKFYKSKGGKIEVLGVEHNFETKAKLTENRFI
jgi:hypothetical protein